MQISLRPYLYYIACAIKIIGQEPIYQLFI